METNWDRTFFDPLCEPPLVPFSQGVEQAKKALELDASNGKAHKWMGICLSKMGDFIPTKEKIGNAFTIKDHWTKALETDPTDATVNHCLGAWCWNVTNVGWIERKAAAMLFATPPESTYEEAEKYYLKAAELDPTFVDNAFALGELYVAMKRKEDAKKWFTTCSEMNATSEKERRMQRDAKTQAGKL